MICKHFSPFWGLSFLFLDGMLWNTKTYFHEIQYNFPLLPVLRYYPPNSLAWWSAPMSFSKNFTVLMLKFMFIIHIKFIYGPTLFFYMGISSSSSIKWPKKPSFHKVFENLLTKNVYFWTLISHYTFLQYFLFCLENPFLSISTYLFILPDVVPKLFPKRCSLWALEIRCLVIFLVCPVQCWKLRFK